MQPLPMNEFVQQNLAEVGIKIEYRGGRLEHLINIWRAGAKDPSAKGQRHQLHLLHPGPLHRPDPPVAVQPRTAGRHQLGLLLRPGDGPCSTRCAPPSTREQDKVLQKIHEKYVDEALFLMVTHDVNPRAMTDQGEGLRPGTELVPGLLADQHGSLTQRLAARRSPARSPCCPIQPRTCEDTMLAYALKRLLHVIPVAIGVSIVCFMLIHIAPGDPLRRSCPPMPRRTCRTRCEPSMASIAAARAICPLGWRTLHGDLGASIASGRPVSAKSWTPSVNSIIWLSPQP
jgi:hypothetical protein